MKLRRIVWWVSIGLISIISSGLLAWYIVISRQQTSVEQLIRGRGFSEGVPTFREGTGSMRENFGSFFDAAVSVVTGSGGEGEATSTPPKLRLISPIPNVGVDSFETASGTLIYFVERPSGNVFSVPVDGGKTSRLTNTLIPRVYEAFWTSEDSVILRNSGESGVSIQTLSANIGVATSSESGVRELVGAYLDDNITAVAVRPNKEEPSLFYLTSGSQGTFGIISNKDGSNPERVWSSAISGWRISWISDDIIIFMQKAASGVLGSSYALSIDSGDVSLIVGSKEGLVTVVHPTANAVIYSTSSGGDVSLFALIDGITRELPLVTLAEKCVWLSGDDLKAYCAAPTTITSSTLPDEWYRGEVSFKDQWFSVDPAAATAELFVDPEVEFGVSLDVLNPELSNDGNYIFFNDANTGTAWVLRI